MPVRLAVVVPQERMRLAVWWVQTVLIVLAVMAPAGLR